MQQLRYGGIYSLPDTSRVVAYENQCGGYVCYLLEDWERLDMEELTLAARKGAAPIFIIDSRGRVFRFAECTDWSIESLIDTGRTAHAF